MSFTSHQIKNVKLKDLSDDVDKSNILHYIVIENKILLWGGGSIRQ